MFCYNVSSLFIEKITSKHERVIKFFDVSALVIVVTYKLSVTTYEGFLQFRMGIIYLFYNNVPCFFIILKLKYITECGVNIKI